MFRNLVLFSLISLFTAGSLQAAPQLIPSPPKLAATGYVLQDFHSGRILAEDNASERMEPASLTKMMTAYAVIHELQSGNIKLDDKVLVSEKAWRMEGSRMFIKVNTRVSVRELLKGMIIQSGNDASVALAEHVAGDEAAFVHLMNGHASSLGMNDTHFANSTGLPDPEHYTTPADMALLAAAIIRQEPEFYSWYAEKKYKYNNIEQYNRNKLLWRDESVDGIKTGHTESAGYCLVASAKRKEMRLITVVMGTKSEDSRARESQKLLNYGFRFFETHRLYGAMDPLKTLRIWKGESEELQLGLTQDLFVTVPRGQYKKLNASMTVDKAIVAPVKQGETFGNVSIKLGEEIVAERKLEALQDVQEGGLIDRLIDQVMMMVK